MFGFLNNSKKFIIPSGIMKSLEQYHLPQKCPESFYLSSEYYDDFVKEVPRTRDTPLGEHRNAIVSFCKKHFYQMVPKNFIKLKNEKSSFIYKIKFIQKTENLFYSDGEFCCNFVEVPFTLPHDVEDKQIRRILICRVLHYILSKDYEEHLKFFTADFRFRDIDFDKIPEDLFPYLSFIFSGFSGYEIDFCSVYMKIPKQFFETFFVQVKRFQFNTFKEIKDFYLYVHSFGHELPKVDPPIHSVIQYEDIEEIVEKLGEKSWIFFTRMDNLVPFQEYFQRFSEERKIEIIKQSLCINIPHGFLTTLSSGSMEDLIHHFYVSRKIIRLQLIFSFDNKTTAEKNKIAEWRSLFRGVVLREGIFDDLQRNQICWIVHIVKVVPRKMIPERVIRHLLETQKPENKIYLLPCKLDSRAKDIVWRCPAYEQIFENVEDCIFKRKYIGIDYHRDDFDDFDAYGGCCERGKQCTAFNFPGSYCQCDS